MLWARRVEVARSLREAHANPDYLPGVALPEALGATASLEEAVTGATLVVLAVPSHGFRQVVADLAPFIGGDVPVVSLSKGLEQGTNARMTQIVEQELSPRVTGVLSGPNLARDIAAGHPAATVVAMTDPTTARAVQDLLHTDGFRIYTNPDLVGCEVAGASKNVLALAAGMAVGLGLGDSSLAALVTRGLAEMGRLVVALGGDPMTVASLAGVGDLVVTCTSPLSRNRSVGVALGSGRGIDAVVSEMRMVAEGVKSARPLVELAQAYGVEMPIGEQVAAVVEGRCTAQWSMSLLMTRSAKAEFAGFGRDDGSPAPGTTGRQPPPVVPRGGPLTQERAPG